MKDDLTWKTAIAVAVVVGCINVGTAAERQPYLAKISETVYNSDTQKVERTSYQLHGVRSDGSSVHAYFVQGSPGQLAHRTVLVGPQQKEIVINDDVAAVSTYNLSHTTVAAQTALPWDPTCYTQPQSSLTCSVLNERQYLGFTVVVVVNDTPTSRVETWEAPALNCFALKRLYEWKKSDGLVHGRTEAVVTEVTLGEPPAELFDVPAKYDELPPSQVIARVEEKVRGGNASAPTGSASERTRFERLDKIYNAARAPK